MAQISLSGSLEKSHLDASAQQHCLPPRASDPEEIYKIHELKMKKEQAVNEEGRLDQLIQMCKQELSLLMENQENWQYPLVI